MTADVNAHGYRDRAVLAMQGDAVRIFPRNGELTFGPQARRWQTRDGDVRQCESHSRRERAGAVGLGSGKRDDGAGANDCETRRLRRRLKAPCKPPRHEEAESIAVVELPAIASDDMPSREPEALLRVNCFEVLIGDRNVGFARVGRLTSETELAGLPDRPIHRFATIVLRRAVTTSTELYDWRRLIISGKDDRRDVTIRQLSAPGGKIVNSWRLLRAWPCRWSGPTFDAMMNDVACEELELAFDDLLWLTADTE